MREEPAIAGQGLTKDGTMLDKGGVLTRAGLDKKVALGRLMHHRGLIYIEMICT